jgi:hypothetical protein
LTESIGRGHHTVQRIDVMETTNHV